MSENAPRRYQPAILPALLFVFTLLLIPGLACNLEEDPPWTPEAPKQYTAETTPVEVYVLIDEAGNVVDFGGAYAYGVNANLRYVLRFWDIGSLGSESHEVATVHKAYTPIRINAINDDLEEGMSAEQKADIYARTSFPTTEVEWSNLNFSGGPKGTFLGTNPETGKEIYGYMDWREKEWEMHACLYHDVMKSGCTMDFLVLGEEPFYNWP